MAFAVARHIRLEAAPTAVIADPDRPFVYVLTPSSGQIHEIDASSMRVRRVATVARVAHSMRLGPGAGGLWVACRDPRSLVRVPLDSFRPERRVDLAAEPFDFDLSADGERAAVTFGQAGSLVLVDLASRSRRILAGGRPLGRVRFRSDGRLLLAGNNADRTLVVLDVGTGRTVVELPLAVRPDHFCVKNDGGQLFITGDGMDGVVFVYPYTTEVAETVLAGKAPGAMAECLDPDANYLFVANQASGEVTVLDIDLRRVVAVVAVGRQPGYIGLTPDQQYALVLNRGSGDIAVIRVAALATRRLKTAPLFTMIPVGSGPVSLAVQRV